MSKSIVLATQSKLLDASTVLSSAKRADDQFRKILIKSRVLEGATGSSYVEIGNTKVICCITGPKEQSNANPQEGSLNVIINGIDQCARYTIQSALSSVVHLKKIARTEIDVEISVLVDDGGALSAALMAASVALVSANIECFDVLLACHFLVRDNGTYVLDPDAQRVISEFNEATRKCVINSDDDAKKRCNNVFAEVIGDDELMDVVGDERDSQKILSVCETKNIAQDVEQNDKGGVSRSLASVTVAIAPSLGQIVFVDASRGGIRRSILNKAIRFGFGKCLEIYPIMSKNLHNYASNLL